MERWINPLLAASGTAAGLLIGTGHPADGALVALLGIALVWGLRAQSRPTRDS